MSTMSTRNPRPREPTINRKDRPQPAGGQDSTHRAMGDGQ